MNHTPWASDKPVSPERLAKDSQNSLSRKIVVAVAVIAAMVGLGFYIQAADRNNGWEPSEHRSISTETTTQRNRCASESYARVIYSDSELAAGLISSSDRKAWGSSCVSRISSDARQRETQRIETVNDMLAFPACVDAGHKHCDR